MRTLPGRALSHLPGNSSLWARGLIDAWHSSISEPGVRAGQHGNKYQSVNTLLFNSPDISPSQRHTLLTKGWQVWCKGRVLFYSDHTWILHIVPHTTLSVKHRLTGVYSKHIDQQRDWNHILEGTSTASSGKDGLDVWTQEMELGTKGRGLQKERIPPNRWRNFLTMRASQDGICCPCRYWVPQHWRHSSTDATSWEHICKNSSIWFE